MRTMTLNRPALPQRQRGMTTLGLIILVTFLGLFAFAALRLAPVYLNFMKVTGVLNGVHEEFDGTGASAAAIRKSISRRFGIESVGELTARDIKVTKQDGGYEVVAVYSHKAPFIANVNFIVDFDRRVTIRR